MEQLKGLHFFMMSDGSYSDYGVGGFYVSEKPITKEMWHTFCEEEYNTREVKKNEIVTANYYKNMYDYSVQYSEYMAWVKTRGSYEQMFAKLHNLVEVGVTELHLDY